jgi:alpha-D-xyloside xylohydrolase
MIKTLVIITILAALNVSSINAQSFIKTESGIKYTIDSLEVEIQFYNPSTVRILKSPEGINITKKSLSVIAAPQKTDFSINQDNDDLYLKSKSVQVELNLKNGRISFSTPAGKSLLNEKQDGVKFTDFNDAGNKTYTVYQAFILDKDEAIYGLGEQQQGKMVKRNLKLNMIQGNTDDYIPFFISAKGYGLFWDNYSPTVFEDNPESTSFKSDVGDCIDYYFMYGGNADCPNAKPDRTGPDVPVVDFWILSK